MVVRLYNVDVIEHNRLAINHGNKKCEVDEWQKTDTFHKRNVIANDGPVCEDLEQSENIPLSHQEATVAPPDNVHVAVVRF